MKDLKLELNEEIAYYLYIGLVTDTQRFLRDSDVETFKMAEELVKFPIDTKKIYKEVDNTSEAIIKFKVFVYTHYKFSKNACYLIIPKEAYLDLGLKQNDILNGYHYWCFFIEDEDGKSVRCEYRSDGTRNVQSIAKKFNGGGHFAASGGTLYSKEEINKVIEYIDSLE